MVKGFNLHGLSDFRAMVTERFKINKSHVICKIINLVFSISDSIPDALTNNCSKCSEKQKAGAEEIIKFMMENKKAEYAELENKFDHDGVYRKKYEATLEE